MVIVFSHEGVAQFSLLILVRASTLYSPSTDMTGFHRLRQNMVPMDRSDAKAVRHLLTATQRFAAQAEQARREREEQAGQQQQAGDDNNRYQYRFDDFENYDQNSDDERDFRDLSHYTTIDTSTGKVTELWLGIINVQAITAANNNSGNDDAKHWTLADDDWEHLSK